MGPLAYIKMAVAGVVILAFVALSGYAAILKHERDAALKEVGALTTAAVTNKATIKELEQRNADWKTALDNFQKTLSAVSENQTESNKHAEELNHVLARHDLAALSLAKPGLVERRINSGTADVLRMLVVESGGSVHGN